MENWARSIVVLFAVTGIPASASAGLSYSQQSISALSNIFGAGLASPPDPGGTISGSDGNFGGGILPPEFDLPANPAMLAFSSVTGTVSLNTFAADNLNDPDGVGGEHSQSSVTSYGGIAGNIAPNSGYLVGVFESSSAPGGTAPAVLNFTAGHLTTSFTTVSPKLYQTFFIGDGLSGDGTGTVQNFVVPAGATRLFLGICDGPGDDSSPGDYDDNTGAFTATFSVTAVPEPACAAVGAFVLPFLTRGRRRCFRSRL